MNNTPFYLTVCVQINGELTLGENIADNGGVHTAYHAYKNVMNGRKAQSYGGLTEDQLFFVSFAQVTLSITVIDFYIMLYYSSCIAQNTL